MKKVRIVFLLIMLTLLAACGSEESQARKTVEKYMDAVKMGEDFEQFRAFEGFYDVFDYEYLRTLDEREVKDTGKISYDIWELVYKDKYPTWEEYKKYEIESLKLAWEDLEIIEENDEEVVYWDGKSYKTIYTFLYNVEIANKIGEKLYKKAEFTVEPGYYWNGDDMVEGWLITDLYLR